MDTILIGIAGGTGSGKTTLADKLVESFGRDEVSILRHDNYYKRHDDIPFEERAKLNYDHPDAFDTDLLCQHILELKAGKSIEMPVYDYAMHNRSDKTILVHPAPVIVLEGILLFVEKDLCDLMDIKVFVDTDAGRADSPPDPARCKRARPFPGQRCNAVPDDRKTDARAVRRAEQAPCRRDHPGGRTEHRCA